MIPTDHRARVRSAHTSTYDLVVAWSSSDVLGKAGRRAARQCISRKLARVLEATSTCTAPRLANSRAIGAKQTQQTRLAPTPASHEPPCFVLLCAPRFDRSRNVAPLASPRLVSARSIASYCAFWHDGQCVHFAVRQALWQSGDASASLTCRSLPAVLAPGSIRRPRASSLAGIIEPGDLHELTIGSPRQFWFARCRWSCWASTQQARRRSCTSCTLARSSALCLL